MMNNVASATAPGGNNLSQMIQQFAAFKKHLIGKNPELIVKGLLQSGKMSPQQFEELSQQANALKDILK